VVEDEDNVRHMTVEALRELGYSVIEASGGKDALQQLAHHPHIDLLFTDIVMPGMNGKMVADAVKDRHPGIKVIFTTGFTRNAIVHNGIVEPGINLLTKPFTLEQLAGKLSDVLKRA
jgi:CheY-like chemotaxis protein